MKECDEVCVVCGEVSSELICRACQALIGAKPLRAAEAPTGMDGWWDGLDEEILAILDAGRPMETDELAAKLGMSTDAVCSCLAMLSTGGRVQIRSVELRPGPQFGARAA